MFFISTRTGESTGYESHRQMGIKLKKGWIHKFSWLAGGDEYITIAFHSTVGMDAGAPYNTILVHLLYRNIRQFCALLIMKAEPAPYKGGRLLTLAVIILKVLLLLS
jgi:hypothetical protein